MATPSLPKIYASAFLCESVLKESTGVISLIRMRDVATIPIQEGVPWNAVFEGELFVSFKSIEPAEFSSTVRMLSPEGAQIAGNEWQIKLNGAPHGHSLMIKFVVPVQATGVYWFTVSIGDIETQRVPLLVRPVPLQGQPLQGQQPSIQSHS